MSQEQPPTRAEFNELIEHVKRIEQQTEPISLRIERGLPLPEATLLNTIMTQVGTMATDIGALQGDVAAIKTRMDTMDSKLDQILDRLPPKS